MRGLFLADRVEIFRVLDTVSTVKLVNGDTFVLRCVIIAKKFRVVRVVSVGVPAPLATVLHDPVLCSVVLAVT